MAWRRPRDDAGVSANVAAILMVGLAIVGGIGLYGAFSGWFNADDRSVGRTASLMSAGPMSSSGAVEWRNLSVASAAVGLDYDEVELTLDGAALPCDASPTATSFRVWSRGAVLPCSGTKGPDAPMGAGDLVEIRVASGGLSGKTLRLVDASANSMMAAIPLR